MICDVVEADKMKMMTEKGSKAEKKIAEERAFDEGMDE